MLHIVCDFIGIFVQVRSGDVVVAAVGVAEMVKVGPMKCLTKEDMYRTTINIRKQREYSARGNLD